MTFSEVGCYEFLSDIVVSLSNGMLLGTAVIIATVSTSGTDYGLQWTGVSGNRRMPRGRWPGCTAIEKGIEEKCKGRRGS
jgi:hypothetical protein